jgi:S1-C subfamily serine protease
VVKDAPPLCEALEKAVAEAEPSIACILVSRSERYKEFDQAPSADEPGQLGDFRFDYANPRATTERKKQALKLDLAQAGTVPEAYGSGVVIDETKAQVLTNYHVVRGATKIYVRLPSGKGSYANIHAADPRSDLAVLQLITKIPLKALKFGDGGKVRKGQMVLSVANPFAAGFRDGSPSASWGIIANIRRQAPVTKRTELSSNKTLHHYGTLLQLDARLNLGCSGGAVINLRGELIGLTTSLAAVSGSETPGGYAVPIDPWFKRIVATLQEGKEVEYGFLGINFDTTPGLKLAKLEYVFPGSPARNAGLQTGDIILAVNGQKIRDTDDVFLPLAKAPPKTEITLDIARPPAFHGGVTRKLTVKPVLAKYAVQGQIIAANRHLFRGVRVDYTTLLIQPPLYNQSTIYREIPRGVVVVEVKARSPAANQLKVGDVITQVDGKDVDNPDDFYQKLEGAKGAVDLTVKSRGKVTVN